MSISISMRFLFVTALCVASLFGCEAKEAAVTTAQEVPPAAEPAEPVAAAAKAEPAAAKAEPVAAAAKVDGRSYGAGVTLPESVDVSKLLANVDEYVGKEVRVEGLVTGVCPKRGCWFDMAGDEPGSSVRFKVQDGVMVFPMEDKGKYAVAQGVVKKIPLTLEQAKQWAKHQKEEYGGTLDPESITGPMTIVRLDGKGAVIRDQK